MSEQIVAQVITEEDLTKSLAELEGKKIEIVNPDPVVRVEPLAKTALDTLGEMGSENLQKALDVSEILDEVVSLMGVHVDRSLEAMQKSLQASAERDGASIRVLERLSKAIEDNTAAMNKVLDKPGSPAATRPITTDTGQILSKATGIDEGSRGDKTPDVKALRKRITDGLDILTKAVKPSSSEASRLANALVKFESTGSISDSDVQAALRATAVAA